MSHIKLGDRLTISIEKENRLRLIVFDGSEELVCRKVNPSELKKFIQAENGHLFKGRLQLDKKDDNIFVSIKGAKTGVIALPEFEDLINQSYQPEQIT